jgi:uncharacterized RDD family membrane protein YckC
VGYRSIAYLIDVSILFGAWLVLYFLYSLLGPSVIEVYAGVSTWVKALAIVGAFAAQWLFWTVSEVMWNGQTPGKKLVRIRVVRIDGQSIGVFESAIRNLVRAVDFLPFGYALGLTVMLLDKRHRRLGDLAAGTLLVREEQIDLAKYAPTAPTLARDLASIARGEALSPSDIELVLEFLSRAPALAAPARDRIAFKMVAHFGRGIPAGELAPFTESFAAAESFLRARVQR